MGRLFDILITPIAVLGVLFVVVAVNVFLYFGYSSRTPTPLLAEHTGPSTTIERPEHKNGKIAFQSDRGGSYEIYTMNADGAKIDKLTTNPAEDEDPAFSPDGKKIGFTSERDGDSDIYTMNADGTRLVQLTTNTTMFDRDPSFSPDGKKIVFRSDRSAPTNSEIYTMNTKGTWLIQLTTDPAVDEDPAFSADGKKIAFESERHGNSDIYKMNTMGNRLVRLTTDPATTFGADWGVRWMGTSE
jgi:Tol biopolymer transport system component